MSTLDDPNCPNCHHGWTRMFLQANLSKAFLKDEYGKHRAELLWKREESFIPQYQTYAVNKLRAEELESTILIPLKLERIQLVSALHNMDEKIREYENEHARYMLRGLAVSAASEETKTFTRKCTASECMGWLSSAWKCGLCNKYTCNECLVVIGEHKKGTYECTHTCLPEDVNTATLIRKSTKPCPKCGEGIEKKEGCNMMFCTSCHTPFDWVSGAIVTHGNIHNPHYYEWMNRQGTRREHGDIPCGGLPPYSACVNKIHSNQILRKVAALHRLTAHVMDIEMGSLNHTINNRTGFQQIMVDYLLKRATKEEIQAFLQKKETKRERSQAFYDVFQTFATIESEYMRAIAEGIQNSGTFINDANAANYPFINDNIQKSIELIEFTNETNKNIASLFGVSYKHIALDITRYTWNIVVTK